MGISPMASMEIDYQLESFFSVGDYLATAENVKKSFIFSLPSCNAPAAKSMVAC